MVVEPRRSSTILRFVWYSEGTYATHPSLVGLLRRVDGARWHLFHPFFPERKRGNAPVIFRSLSIRLCALLQTGYAPIQEGFASSRVATVDSRPLDGLSFSVVIVVRRPPFSFRVLEDSFFAHNVVFELLVCFACSVFVGFVFVFVAQDVAVDAEANVYVADTGNHRIRRITPEVRFVWRGTGTMFSLPPCSPRKRSVVRNCAVIVKCVSYDEAWASESGRNCVGGQRCFLQRFTTAKETNTVIYCFDFLVRLVKCIESSG